jgi:NADPH:quinone reductase-like Zn-dependent oxidoreductase
MTTCNPAKLMISEATLVGSSLKNASDEERTEMSVCLDKMVGEGRLHPYINKEYPLEEAEAAHTDMQNSKGACGKSILVL